MQLWHRYLRERVAAARPLPPAHGAHAALLNTFERALATMHKMPRIWLEYIDALVDQGYVTRTRRALDRALAALPVTQHDRLWAVYLQFVTRPGVPKDTAYRVYRRYLQCALILAVADVLLHAVQGMETCCDCANSRLATQQA